MVSYNKFRNDVIKWIESDRGRKNTFYSSFIDLYGFPRDKNSPYSTPIQNIADPYKKISALENAIGEDIANPNFIPYVQLHEFETFLFVNPEKLLIIFPEKHSVVNRLKKEIKESNPELINDTPLNSPSKRIIKYIPEYEDQKAQVGPLIAQDIGIEELRNRCYHFNDWLTKLESLLNSGGLI